MACEEVEEVDYSASSSIGRPSGAKGTANLGLDLEVAAEEAINPTLAEWRGVASSGEDLGGEITDLDLRRRAAATLLCEDPSHKVGFLPGGESLLTLLSLCHGGGAVESIGEGRAGDALRRGVVA